MAVTDPELVIVRGINHEWINQNFTEMWIGFAGTAVGIPKRDAHYIGLYLEAPISQITHIGIVDSIDRHDDEADFYLRALVKLKTPIKPDHAIRKHEYWTLKDFGITKLDLVYLP